MKIQRIAVLTGGGDAPGLNAVLRAVTRTAILQEGWEVLGIRHGFEGLLSNDEGDIIPLTWERVAGLLARHFSARDPAQFRIHSGH